MTTSVETVTDRLLLSQCQREKLALEVPSTLRGADATRAAGA